MFAETVSVQLIFNHAFKISPTLFVQLLCYCGTRVPWLIACAKLGRVGTTGLPGPCFAADSLPPRTRPSARLHPKSIFRGNQPMLAARARNRAQDCRKAPRMPD